MAGKAWKVDANGDLIPMDQWNQQQANQSRQAEITKYIDPDPATDLWMPPSQNEIMANGPHNPQHHFQVNEKADPISSSHGFVIRYSAVCCLLLFLSFGAVWAVTGAFYIMVSLGVFGLLGVGAFVVLTRQDYQHSSAGTERQKTQELGSTLRQQMSHNHDYRMQKLKLDHQYRMEKVS